MARHARLSPSSSDIWLKCLGAPREWQTRPPRQAGFAAHEGTLAHVLCEASLNQLQGRIPWQPGMKFTVEGDEIEITQEMLDGVGVFVQVATMLSDLAVWRIVEGEVSLLWLWADEEPPEEIFGTIDFAVADTSTLYIIDFKFGKKAVQPSRNTQLLIYALGVLGRLRSERPELFESLENVCLVIVQPRAGGDPVRQWTIPVADVLYWGFSVLKPSIDRIWLNGALPLTPGSHCWWCPASIDCEVYLKDRRETHAMSYPEYDPDKEDLAFEELI